MTNYNFFTTSAKWWLYTLLLVNQISLYFMNTLDQGTKSFNWAYASAVFNILISYLIILFIYLNHKTITAEMNSTENPKPFHQWIWFNCSSYEKWVTCLFFGAWMIPNVVHLFFLNGLGYLIGIFFVISIFYWFLVMGAIWRSYRKSQLVSV